jgi:hypothetical protein
VSNCSSCTLPPHLGHFIMPSSLIVFQRAFLWHNRNSNIYLSWNDNLSRCDYD